MVALFHGSSKTDDQLHDVIVAVLAGSVPEASRISMRVTSIEDFEGRPALSVVTTFPDDVAIPAGETLAQLQRAIGKALLARGEDRFPYLRLLHEADQEELAALDQERPDA